MEANSPGHRQGVSAALAAAQANATVAATMPFPGGDKGVSLADLAQRDLDAALQLLAERAQYITGASGAAIALRRDGRDDMLCRASVGSNAPELGALLSTEFGLSGESVRTRQLLRCDDAERDVRVNREVCRQMGIASVLVMPVVNDGQVLGVFELFSGKANAFGERDLSAVQRLSEMVETAVRLAYAAEHLPDQLKQRESSVPEAVHPEVSEGQFLGDLVVEPVQPPPEPQSVETAAATAPESPGTQAIPPVVEMDPKANTPELEAGSAPPAVPAESLPAKAVPPVDKPLFGSAAAASEGEAGKSTTDLSHVPPVLRGLRKCQACGFPVSAGRVLCVECEEKKWRGQSWTQESARKPPAGVVLVPDARTAGWAFPAAASIETSKAPARDPGHVREALELASTQFEIQGENSASEPADELTGKVFPALSGLRKLILSAGIEVSRLWFSAHKRVVLALLAGAIGVTAFLLLR